MNSSNRTPAQKAADTATVYDTFRDLLTTDTMRNVLGDMTNAQMQAAASVGDVQAYASLVDAALKLSRLVAGNDRAALLAAAMVTQSGIVKPQLEVVEDGD